MSLDQRFKSGEKENKSRKDSKKRKKESEWRRTKEKREEKGRADGVNMHDSSDNTRGPGKAKKTHT